MESPVTDLHVVDKINKKLTEEGFDPLLEEARAYIVMLLNKLEDSHLRVNFLTKSIEKILDENNKFNTKN